MKAMWHGQVIADSDRTLEVKGYRYFPRDAVRMDLLHATAQTESDLACPHGPTRPPRARCAASITGSAFGRTSTSHELTRSGCGWMCRSREALRLPVPVCSLKPQLVRSRIVKPRRRSIRYISSRSSRVTSLLDSRSRPGGTSGR